jgi:hypothetical protein
MVRERSAHGGDSGDKGRDRLLLNCPSRVQVSRKRLIQLQAFGRRGSAIRCVGDLFFDASG